MGSHLAGSVGSQRFLFFIIHEESGLPKCDAVSLDQLLSTFRNIVDAFPFTGQSVKEEDFNKTRSVT